MSHLLNSTEWDGPGFFPGREASDSSCSTGRPRRGGASFPITAALVLVTTAATALADSKCDGAKFPTKGSSDSPHGRIPSLRVGSLEGSTLGSSGTDLPYGFEGSSAPTPVALVLKDALSNTNPSTDDDDSVAEAESLLMTLEARFGATVAIHVHDLIKSKSIDPYRASDLIVASARLSSKASRGLAKLVSEALLSDSDPVVRDGAVKALLEIGSKTSIEPLMRLLETERSRWLKMAIQDAIDSLKLR